MHAVYHHAHMPPPLPTWTQFGLETNLRFHGPVGNPAELGSHGPMSLGSDID